MKKITTKLMMAVVLLAAMNAAALKMRPNMLFSAKLDGTQEVPAVTGSGIGVASFMLNATRDSMCVNVTFTGLTGTVTGVHIHNGAPGVAGGVVVNLMPFLSGNRLTGIITGTALTTTLKSNMLKGLTYINIHTAANSGGEIRGQIMLETDMAFVGDMSGAQEVPAVTTGANGYAVFNVSHDQTMVTFYVVTNGLSGAINAAHIHSGAFGVAGGVIQNLTTFITGNVLVGSFTPSANVISNLMAGTAYVNVHTTANPGGEIRGQLRMDDKIPFDAWMDGAQEVPSVSTPARGLASLRLNTTMDSLWYFVYTTGLSGAITNAHIHNGAVGVSGGVAVGFAAATGNILTGTITGASLTSTLINNMLSGNTYVNVHTAANSSGEIRGQVWRVMREGYTISMDGAQENPVVSTGASGSGIVSINRDLDNAHYMMATNNTAPTAMHFHKAILGTNGGVINDIFSSYSNNYASGYWKTTSTTPFSPFTTTRANQIDADSVYVNLHTAANAGGEIRGQVRSGFRCIASSVITGLIPGAGELDNNFHLFPNPTTGKFSLIYGTKESGNLEVNVYDLMGKVILTNNIQLEPGQNGFEMEMKDQASGIYFVKVRNGEQYTIKKLIIE